MTTDNDPKLSLVLDALFLAQRLTNELRDSSGWEFTRLNRVTNKAWARYNRRVKLVEGLKVVE